MSKPKDGHLKSRTVTGSLARSRLEALLGPVLEAHSNLALDTETERATLLKALVEALST